MNTKHKPKKILLFVTATPTSEDKALARRAGVLIRDPRAYRTGDFVEACNAVAGDVPPAYRERYLVLSPNDLAEIVRPFAPAARGGSTETELSQSGEGLNGDAPAALGELSETSAEPPSTQPQQPESSISETTAADESKATVDSLKAALDAKEILYPKTAKKAELQALLAAAA